MGPADLRSNNLLKKAPVKYAGSATITSIAAAIQFFIYPYIDPSPYILFYPAIVLSTLYFGLHAGILSMVLGLVLVKYFFAKPFYSLTILWPEGVLRPFLFAFASGIIIWVTNEFRKSREKMFQAIKSRDEFLSLASHELKTPLTSLKLQVQLVSLNLKRGENRKTTNFDSDKIIQMMEQSNKQIDRMTSLINEMLEIAEVAAGKCSMTFTPVEFCLLAKRAVNRNKETEIEERTEVHLACSDYIQGIGDPVKIEQMILFMLKNACKFGKGKPVYINVSLEENFVVFSVEDSGMGIEKKDHRRIFERYERAVDPSEVSGLGLGLYFSKFIAEKHGGSISIDSEIKKGSKFVAKIPRFANENK